MASANSDQIKYLVIKNLSNVELTLYIYDGWSPFCKWSTISKIIKPGQRYCHDQETPFKFEITAKLLNEETENILRPDRLNENMKITITESLKCQTENIALIENGHRLYLRQIQRKKEVGPGKLYEILELDMENIRKMENVDAQKEAIEKAYKKQMLIWHPDKNFGDGEIAVQIILAKKILMDDERRARYHNEVYYNKGWFSKGRWKAIFWPDCYTEKQKKDYRHRMGMLLASLALATAGITISVVTAGAATPLVVALGAVFGGGLTGAGFQSLEHTMSKKSALEGCDPKSWALKAGIGFVGGMVTGCGAFGITWGMVGIGSAALQSGTVTAAQYVGMGGAIGAVGGVVSSLSKDVAKKIVDKEKVTAKQAVLRAACGAVIGAGAGALGGLVTKGIIDGRASAATSSLEGDAVEQISALTAGRRLGDAAAHAASKQVAMAGTRAVMRVPSNVVQERLDDSVENQKVTKHIQDGLENFPVHAAQNAFVHTAGGCIGHGITEAVSDEPYNNQAQGNIQGLENEDQSAVGENGNEDANEKESKTNNETNGKEKEAPGTDEGFSRKFFTANEKSQGRESDNSGSKPNNADWNKPESGRSPTPNETAPEQEEENDEGLRRSSEQNQHVNNENKTSEANQSKRGESLEQSDEKTDEPDNVIIKYICKKNLKMIVKYDLNGEQITEEVRGDYRRVCISADAINVEVRFQVRRPLWGDIMKYDRFQKTWCKPYTPHIFRYPRAVDRTFIIEGFLRWEAVMRVSNEYHEETNEMS